MLFPPTVAITWHNT